MKPFLPFLPWAVVLLAVVFLAVSAAPPSTIVDGMHIDEFARLPVAEGGRVKPMDTLARNNLMAISDRQTYQDKDGEKPAIQWLLDVLTRREGAGDSGQRRAFRVDDQQLQMLLRLPPRNDGLYAFAELEPRLDELFAESKRLSKASEPPAVTRSPAEPSAYETKLRELTAQVLLYHENLDCASPQQVFRIDNDQVLNLLLLEPRSGLRYSFAEILPRLSYLVREAARARKRDEAQRDLFDAKVLQLTERLTLYLGLARMSHIDALPTAHGESWRKLDTIFDKNVAPNDQAVRSYHAILLAYIKKDGKGFNREVEDYQNWLGAQLPGDASETGFEVFFNSFAPFYRCVELYFLAFILVCLTWLGLPSELNRAAFFLILVTLVVHTFGLWARMVISHRPLVVVTNLYSSAVFIGYVGVILGLVLEGFFKDGIGNAVAAVTAIATCIIAHNLAAGGDTLEMLQAVLDTNFWLATHVTCVTVGYSATFVAGLLGIIFIVRGMLSTTLTPQVVKTLGQRIYGIVCFATLFSFVGTVLGGIWADQSWGRFWGWDPKENGALLIVLWNALILHARWGGMVKQRGMAVLAVGGNIVTAWSWFGVNMLGVGLHSYGFMSGAVPWLVGFELSQLALMIVAASVPLRLWRSFATSVAPQTPDTAEAPRGKRRRQPAIEGA